MGNYKAAFFAVTRTDKFFYYIEKFRKRFDFLWMEE